MLYVVLTLYSPWLFDVFWCSSVSNWYLVFSWHDFSEASASWNLQNCDGSLPRWTIINGLDQSLGHTVWHLQAIDSIDVLFPCDICFDNWITEYITNNETQHVNPIKLIYCCVNPYTHLTSSISQLYYIWDTHTSMLNHVNILILILYPYYIQLTSYNIQYIVEYGCYPITYYTTSTHHITTILAAFIAATMEPPLKRRDRGETAVYIGRSPEEVTTRQWLQNQQDSLAKVDRFNGI